MIRDNQPFGLSDSTHAETLMMIEANCSPGLITTPTSRKLILTAGIITLSHDKLL